jgi:hypothetical protein
MSLQSDLDAIAARQGKSIPPGNYIEGGGNWPQTDAALPGERFTAQHDDDEDDDVGNRVDPSPLIPRAAELVAADRRHINQIKDFVGVAHAPDPEILENFRAPDLTILGNDDAAYIAAYQGRQVELSGWEQAQVRKVVLTAIKRTIMAQLGEVDALLPKRKRRAVEPKKRGRPKKVAP